MTRKRHTCGKLTRLCHTYSS